MADNAQGRSVVERERQMLAEAHAKGGLAKYKTFVKLSGPGWIASAITLGGGSMASSLYLGVLGGYSLLWLQPFAMILGIIMLSAIGYVTLSSDERPFPAINNHVSPVLGWGWALAIAIANVIYTMPQFSLAFAVLSQNLLPSTWFGPEGSLQTWASAAVGDSYPWLVDNFDKFFVSAVILIITTIITWSYDTGGWGLRLYEWVLKIVVAMIVLCFVGVVLKLSFSDDPLPWGEIARNLVPDFGQFFRPAETFGPLLDAIGAAGSSAREYWASKIVSEQRDVMISAAATAVGINMTLMFPYTMLRKGWTREFRGLAVFDLATGMFVPYIIATGCIVIAAASQFHTKLPLGFTEQAGPNGSMVLVIDEASPKYAAYYARLAARDAALAKADGVAAAVEPPSDAEKRIAAMLVRRDALDLSSALAPLTGSFVANFVFGLGILAMVLSTISILMLISGFVFAEMMAFPPGGKAHKLGTLVAGVGGAMWPLFWAGQSQFFLAVVTAVFAFMVLPFAYVTFVFLMNSKSLLGGERPRGFRRFVWNVLTISAAAIISVAAVYMINVKAGYAGLGAVGAFVALALLVWVNQTNTRRPQK